MLVDLVVLVYVVHDSLLLLKRIGVSPSVDALHVVNSCSVVEYGILVVRVVVVGYALSNGRDLLRSIVVDFRLDFEMVVLSEEYHVSLILLQVQERVVALLHELVFYEGNKKVHEVSELEILVLSVEGVDQEIQHRPEGNQRDVLLYQGEVQFLKLLENVVLDLGKVLVASQVEISNLRLGGFVLLPQDVYEVYPLAVELLLVDLQSLGQKVLYLFVEPQVLEDFLLVQKGVVEQHRLFVFLPDEFDELVLVSFVENLLVLAALQGDEDFLQQMIGVLVFLREVALQLLYILEKS